MIPPDSLYRGVLVAALLPLIGAPPTLWFVVFPELERRGFDTTQAHRAALYLVGTTLVGAVLAATALAIANAQPSGADSFAARVVSTSAGQAWAILIVAASVPGVLTIGRLATPIRVSRRLWLGTVFVGALAMLLVFCLTRYSPAAENRAVAILVKFGHMSGVALWVGGLSVLAVFPALIPGDSNTDTARLISPIVRRFSMIAVAGVTLAFVGGVVITAWHVPTPAALVSTPYGVLLSAKVGLVLVAAAIGGFNRFVLHERIACSASETNELNLPGMLTVSRPRIAPNDAVTVFVRSIRLELAVLVLAIGLSIGLTTGMTPSYEVLDPTVVEPDEAARQVSPAGFTTVLELGTVGIALVGSLVFGYELGKFGPDE